MNMRFSLLATLACLAISGASEYKGKNDYFSFDVGIDKNADWMDTIADDTHLSSLSIPGTHHSMATDLDNSLMQTQNQPLETQLEGGIRYIDITCKYWEYDIFVFHGFSRTFYTLGSVLETLFAFLLAHPREAIILRIRRSDILDNSETFFDSFEKKFTPGSFIGDRAAKYIYGIDNYPITAPRTLGQIRGKIFILQDFETTPPGCYGLPWNPDTVSSFTGKFSPGTLSMEWKWAGIKSHLNEEPSPDTNRLRVTHATASTGISPIDVVAVKDSQYGMNRLLTKHIAELDAESAGIIAMDFPGQYLVDNILKLNNKYQAPKPGSIPSDSTDTATAEDGHYNA